MPALARKETSTSTLQAIVLGIVQGITEWAPISSSGHLILVPWLFNWRFFLDNPDLNKTFDVALHMGTFVGALAYFWRDVARYMKAWLRSIPTRRASTLDERLAWYLVVGTLPGVLVGALGEDVIEGDLGQPWIIALMLAVFGVVLYVVDRRASRGRHLEDLRLRDAVILGVAQAVALQPGVSRSGVTITAARGLRLDREPAARFSFLLSMPIVGGAGVYKGLDLLREGLPSAMVWPFIWGTLASAVSGFLTVWLLLAYVRKRDFGPFVVYRLAAAALVFALILLGIRGAS